MTFDVKALRERQAAWAKEGAEAMADYHAGIEATRRTTARLRAERLARVPIPEVVKTTGRTKAVRKATKAVQKAKAAS